MLLAQFLKHWQKIPARTTLAGWQAAYSGHRISTKSIRDICAEATTTLAVGPQATVTSGANFYVPAPPESLELPQAVNDTLSGDCPLRYVWVETRTSSPEQAAVVLDGVRDALAETYGWPVREPKSGPGMVWAVPQGHFQLRSLARPAGEITIRLEGFDDGRPQIAAGGSVREQAGAPVNDILAPALALRADQGVAQRVNELARRLATPSNSKRLTLAEQAEVAAVLGLLSRSEGTSERRAASLLAADLLLTQLQWSAADFQGRELSPLQIMLEPLGARFVRNELGGSHEFDHGWLMAASRLNPAGPVGDLVFLAQLRMGFETSFACRDQAGAGFRAVVDRGERYLAENRGSRMAAEVHLLVAQAYSDAIAVGEFLPELYDPDEARLARSRALQHYRASLRLDRTAAARDFWPVAWRLTAGLTPGQTRFVCHSD